MPASDAQIAANRRNSQRSTGPKTTEGKERSRRNSLKHGLTGEGVALTDEDAADVAERIQTLEAELQPSGLSSRLFLRRFAYLSIRLERCERLDTAVYAKRARHAEAEFLDHRLAQVENLAARLSHDPMTNARRLQATPEGIDYLLSHWAELRGDLMNRQRNVWSLNHWSRMERLLGHPEENYRIPRTHALTQALAGYPNNIDPSELEGLNEAERVEWARGELAKVVDAEVERLQAVREGLDPDAIERDRAEAVDRCLFDLQPAMNQVRKYEAATERGMYKALKEFRAMEATLKETGIEPELSPKPEDLASFEPASEREATIEQPEPRTLPPSPLIPETIQFTKTRSLDRAPKSVESLETALC